MSEIKPFTSAQWENDGASVLGSYVDIEDGVVDVRLGGMEGSHPRAQARQSRLLAGLLLQRAGPDGGPLFTHEHITALVWARGAIERVAQQADPDTAHLLARVPDLTNEVIDRLAALLPPGEP